MKKFQIFLESIHAELLTSVASNFPEMFNFRKLKKNLPELKMKKKLAFKFTRVRKKTRGGNWLQ